MKKIILFNFLPIFVLSSLLLTSSALAQEFPFCQSSSSDLDGDGWGWENQSSCIVNNTNSSTTTTLPSNSSKPCIDEDGDGWGWNGTASCIPDSTGATTTTTAPSGSRPCIDEDGDGWGWDGVKSCIPGATGATTTTTSSPSGSTSTTTTSPSIAGPCVDEDGDGYGWDGVKSCTPEGNENDNNNTSITSGITDIVVMMGQSNALGHDTKVNLSLDSPNDRVIVWTEFNGWQVADLCTQKWQNGWFPWRGGLCSNHPAFQIAKAIVNDEPNKKVAFIPTGYSGKPISFWDPEGPAYVAAKLHVEEALAELPAGSKVNLIAWSQGEADHGSEDNWYNKLVNLIFRLRGETWFDAQNSVFIAQETKWASVNTRVKDLASDNDSLTDWIPAEDLPTKDGVHWSGDSLRELGKRYSAKYLNIIGN